MAADLKTILGQRMRAARLRAGLSQEALASRVGRTPESISNIERGRQLPGIGTLAELAGALGVPIAEFFEEIEVRAPPRSARRLELEARLRELGRTLDDRDLAIAVAQADVLRNVQN